MMNLNAGNVEPQICSEYNAYIMVMKVSWSERFHGELVENSGRNCVSSHFDQSFWTVTELDRIAFRCLLLLL